MYSSVKRLTGNVAAACRLVGAQQCLIKNLHETVCYTGVQICQIMGCCQYGYEHLGYIKCKEFLD